mgnify:CR=1 FL=1
MGLFNKISALFQSSQAPDEAVTHAYDQIAGQLPEIAAIPGGHRRLMPLIEQALAHYERIAATIPGPVPLSVAAHGDSSVLATLFPSADEITQGLGRSLAVRNSLSWFVDHSHQSVVAVMGMRHREVTPGSACFTDHTIRSLGTSVGDTRRSLCEAAFSSLVKTFATQSAERQRQWRLTHSTKAVHRELNQRNGVADHPPVGDDQEPTPEHELERLAEWLMAPEAHLRIDEGHSHRVNGHDGGDSALEIPLLATNDRRKWLVCLVEFPLSEALKAVERETQPHRYILI